RLGREEAVHVIRRAARLLAPYRRRIVASVSLVVVGTLCTLAGPYLVRYGIDEGIARGDAGALNLAVVAYVAVALSNFVVLRSQVALVGRIGEGFLRDLRIR